MSDVKVPFLFIDLVRAASDDEVGEDFWSTSNPTASEFLRQTTGGMPWLNDVLREPIIGENSAISEDDEFQAN